MGARCLIKDAAKKRFNVDQNWGWDFFGWVCSFPVLFWLIQSVFGEVLDRIGCVLEASWGGFGGFLSGFWLKKKCPWWYYRLGVEEIVYQIRCSWLVVLNICCVLWGWLSRFLRSVWWEQDNLRLFRRIRAIIILLDYMWLSLMLFSHLRAHFL